MKYELTESPRRCYVYILLVGTCLDGYGCDREMERMCTFGLVGGKETPKQRLTEYMSLGSE